MHPLQRLCSSTDTRGVRNTPLTWVARVCALYGLCAMQPLAAQEVHRCIGPEGQPVFSDRTCDQLNLRERGVEPPEEEEPDRTGMCPAPDVDALNLVIGDAFARHDVNTLAGLYHWPSVDPGGSKPILDWMQEMLHWHLIGIHSVQAPRQRITENGLTRMVSITGEDVEALDLHLVSEPPGRQQIVRVDVVPYAGCWWIRESLTPANEH